MGRGRGKGRKLSTSSHADEFEEEEKIPVQKRRGRPQKPLKEAFDDEEAEKVEEGDDDGEDAKSGITTKETKSPVSAENGKKRRRNTPVKDKPSSVKEENGSETRYSTEDSTKPNNGFRQNGSRRKSKPRRAAEVGVECRAATVSARYDASKFNRSSFPQGFIFGTASSSYQYEGAANEGGRGPSIWDTFTHKYPGKIRDSSTGDVAIDSYHRYKEDVGIMKDMGLDAYRFSISWTRILPRGKLTGGVNRGGVQYYNLLINELLANGIRPFVTLFHWDLPQALEDEYGGFLSPRVVDDYRDYTEVCFREFGDRVKHWITLNEPWSYAMGGYGIGLFAPGRCSPWQQLDCIGGDSGTEPYLVSHHQLLAHAAAVRLYKQKYQEAQKGKIGITLVSQWMVPFSDAKRHQNAATRALDFMLGWFLDPLTHGEYPHTMRTLVGARLPTFTREQSSSLNGSFDFIGINYYTANYAAHIPGRFNSITPPPSYVTDARVNLTTYRHGTPIGPKAASDWLYVYPRGLRDLLLYIKSKYQNPLIYVTENGIDEFNNSTLPLEQQLADNARMDFYYRHLSYLQSAIGDGVNVKGYFAWSLLDNFEWSSGYTVRFGINYVDYNDGLKRHPKLSASWFKSFLRKTS